MPEDQLTQRTTSLGFTSNSLQLIAPTAIVDTTSNSLPHPLPSPTLASHASSSSHLAYTSASPLLQTQSVQQRSTSLASVTSLQPQAQQSAASSISPAQVQPQAGPAPAHAVHARRAVPATLTGPRLGSEQAQAHVIRLGPIFQPMLAALQTNPFSQARALTQPPVPLPHPHLAQPTKSAPVVQINAQLQQMLRAAQAVGYCQGLRHRAVQTGELPGLTFHRQGTHTRPGSDPAVEALHVSQPPQQQPDEGNSHQAVVASDAQISAQTQQPLNQLEPISTSVVSDHLLHPQAGGDQVPSDPSPDPSQSPSQMLRESHSLPLNRAAHDAVGQQSETLSGSKRAHESSEMHAAGNRQRLVQMAQLQQSSSDQTAAGHVIKIRCNVADILDVHCGTSGHGASSDRASAAGSSSLGHSSSSTRVDSNRASSGMPITSSAAVAGLSHLPAIPAVSTLFSAAITSVKPSLHMQSQDMARRAMPPPQRATAQSIAEAVAAAQGTEWALAAHAAALRSSLGSRLPNQAPLHQHGVAGQAQTPSHSGGQSGVPPQSIYALASFPEIMNQLMLEPKQDFMPAWVSEHHPSVSASGQMFTSGAAPGLVQEDTRPAKRVRHGKPQPADLSNGIRSTMAAAVVMLRKATLCLCTLSSIW